MSACFGGEPHPPEKVQNRYCLKCGEHWNEDARDPDDLIRENEVLRGLVQTNPEWKCPYGVNSRSSMGFCSLGFPGCLCADDRIGVEIVEAAENARLRVGLSRAAGALRIAEQFIDATRPGAEMALQEIRKASQRSNG